MAPFMHDNSAPKLSATDIRPAVEAVLRQTDNYLSACQILERLPAELRDRLLRERGFPGVNNGNPFTAVSLVTQAAALLESLYPPAYSSTYMDGGGVVFHLAGKEITHGHSAVAVYRLRLNNTENGSV